MFIWDDDVIHIETQFNYSKLHMFSNMVKSNIRLCERFFLHKINEDMQRKPGIKYFVHSLVWTSLTSTS